MTPERRREIERHAVECIFAPAINEYTYGIIRELLAEIDTQAKQIERLWGRIDEFEKQVNNNERGK
jgi:hypothetical protein